MATAVGIDIGGTKTAAAMVRADGSVLRRCRFATPDRPEVGVERLAQALEPWIRERNDTAGCGLAAPGPLDLEAGVIDERINLPGWAGYPLVEAMEQALNLPVTLLNDALAAAVAESRLGRGKGLDPVLYLTISTGIGGGLVAGGEPYQGARGNAAEVGHMTIIRGGRRCGCGRQGCLEAYASGTAIARAARQALNQQPDRPDWAAEGTPVTAEHVVRGVENGEPLAVSIWHDAVAVLAAGLVNLVHLYDPAIIVLGGGVTAAGDLLFNPLRQQVQADILGPADVPIEPAALAADVGVIGAALTVLG